jgi:hypothetical protein
VLQELVAQTGASAWAIGSMLFFLAAWAAVVVWVVGQRPEELEAQARLPLESEGATVTQQGIRSRESGFSDVTRDVRDTTES